MKCLSIMQPYATLITLGFKRFETRSWSTDYRGPLLIHASKHYGAKEIAVAHDNLIASFLKDMSFRTFKDLPRGKLIATVDLTDCQPCGWHFDQETNDFLERPQELLCGFWHFSNFAWQLAAPEPFTTPITARGHRGLYDQTLPTPVLR